MKQCKFTLFVKEITSTIILCFSMAFFVIIFGIMFINDHIHKFTNTYALCNSSTPFSSSFLPSEISIHSENLKDRIAPLKVWHSMNDSELALRASIVSNIDDSPYNRTPKVAFMFLVRGRLYLAPIWEKFFKGHEGFYSIYIHTSPNFTYEPPQSSVFYKRRISSKPVEWGKATMVDAERRLLANALIEFSNERFILLSETCIPLFNFTTIYNYLINSNTSFLSSFDDPRRVGRGRYNKRMWPTVSLSDWRKGSQWFEIHRKIAINIISDVHYYPTFKEHCKPPCYMDEHYFATLVTKISPKLNSNRTITWVDWSRGGSHPMRFVRKDVTKGFLNYLRNGFNCTYNGRISSICFLFARKFHPSTLDPLLRIAPSLLQFES